MNPVAPDTAGPASIMEPVPVVQLTDLRRSFPGPPEVHAVRGVDLRIDRGEYVSIIGPSGSGKSTLLHLLGLLDQPTGGEYRLDGEDVSTLSERRRSTVRGSRIGFVFQAFHLLPSRTVLDNVMLSMLYQAVPRRLRRQRAEDALGRVGLDHRREFTPRTLSGGERQRVAIARALAAEPSLLLADEPTGNLDRVNASGVLDLFAALHAEGLTLAVITHDEQVSRRAERRVRMTDGRLVAA